MFSLSLTGIDCFINIFKDSFQNSLMLSHYTIDKVAAQIRLKLEWYTES